MSKNFFRNPKNELSSIPASFTTSTPYGSTSNLASLMTNDSDTLMTNNSDTMKSEYNTPQLSRQGSIGSQNTQIPYYGNHALKQEQFLNQDQYLGQDQDQEEDPKKIDVDEKKLAKTTFDDVIEAKQWKGLEINRHMGIVGATTAGKTTFFKTMLADQKIPICDVYIVVGDSPGKSEIITGFCTLEYLTNHSYANKKYMHFNTSELEKAFAFCLADENNSITKCLFLSDILISSAKVKDRTANFMNRAKNYKTSVIVEIHHLAGESMVLMRNALAVIVYLDQIPKALARALDMSVVDNIISKYSGLTKFDKVLIHDKQEGIFNKHYLPF